jgi:ubiquinol-cytochrome c reductase cytochrome b subunit
MIIKLAKNAEVKAKSQPRRPAGKSSINIPESWIYIIFVALLAFQIYLNIAAYYAVLSGMKNFSLFIVGIIMLVFAGMFHLYRHAKTTSAAPRRPLKPMVPPSGAKPIPTRPSPPTPGLPPESSKVLSPPPSPKGQTAATQSPSRTDPVTRQAKLGATKDQHMTKVTMSENSLSEAMMPDIDKTIDPHSSKDKRI